MSPTAVPLVQGVEPGDARARPRLSSVVSRLMGANLAFVAVAMITGPLQARALGPKGRGELAAITVPLALAPGVLTLGLSLYAQRASAIGKRSGMLLGTIGTLLLALGLMSAALGPVIAALIGGANHVERTWIIFGFALLPIGYVNTVIMDIATGQNRWGPVLLGRLTPAIVLLGGIPYLYVTGHLTVASAALLSISGGTLPVLFLVPGARKQLPLSFDWRIVKEAVPFGLKAWAAGLGRIVNVRADQLLMTILVNPSQLGLYVIAVTSSGVLVNPFASALATATTPRFATGDTDLIERTLRATLLGVLLISATVALATPVVIPTLFGSAFRAAVPMTWILLSAGVPLTGGVVLSNALTVSGRPSYAARAELVALSVTVPGLIVLLPALGGRGAALVSVIAYSASFTMLVRAARRELGARLTALLFIRPADAITLAQVIRSQIPRQLLGKSRSTS
jgi:O-antigen/teichoic acid export membrane protein